MERFSVEKDLSKSAVITLALDRLQQSEKGVADENGKKNNSSPRQESAVISLLVHIILYVHCAIFVS